KLLRQNFYFFDKGKTKFVVTCTALAEGGEKLDPVFEGSRKTFRFGGRNNRPPSGVGRGRTPDPAGRQARSRAEASPARAPDLPTLASTASTNTTRLSAR